MYFSDRKRIKRYGQELLGNLGFGVSKYVKEWGREDVC